MRALTNHLAIAMSFAICTIAHATGDGMADDRACGARALKAVLCSIKIKEEVDLIKVMDGLPRKGSNLTLNEISKDATSRWGVFVLALRWKDRPPKGAAPAVIPLLNRELKWHFVAVTEWEITQAHLQDGERQEWIEFGRLRNAGWDGTALHIAADRASLNEITPSFFDALQFHWIVASSVVIIFWTCSKSKKTPTVQSSCVATVKTVSK